MSAAVHPLPPYAFMSSTGALLRFTFLPYSFLVTICIASGQYMYRQWSLYVPLVVTIGTAQWSLYVPPVVTICTASGHCRYRTVVTICTASGHYMYR